MLEPHPQKLSEAVACVQRMRNMGPMLVLVLAATRIQKHWRGMRTRRALRAGGVAAVVGQSAWGQTAEQTHRVEVTHQQGVL